MAWQDGSLRQALVSIQLRSVRVILLAWRLDGNSILHSGGLSFVDVVTLIYLGVHLTLSASIVMR